MGFWLGSSVRRCRLLCYLLHSDDLLHQLAVLSWDCSMCWTRRDKKIARCKMCLWKSMWRDSVTLLPPGTAFSEDEADNAPYMQVLAPFLPAHSTPLFSAAFAESARSLEPIKYSAGCVHMFEIPAYEKMQTPIFCGFLSTYLCSTAFCTTGASIPDWGFRFCFIQAAMQNANSLTHSQVLNISPILGGLHLLALNCPCTHGMPRPIAHQQ